MLGASGFFFLRLHACKRMHAGVTREAGTLDRENIAASMSEIQKRHPRLGIGYLFSDQLQPRDKEMSKYVYYSFVRLYIEPRCS